MKRKIVIFLALLLLVMPVTAGAESLWQMSADMQTLTHNGTEYGRYYLDLTDMFMPEGVLVLDQTGIFTVDSEEYEVHKSAATDEIVAVYDTSRYEKEYVYATRRGMGILDRFKAGEYGAYLLMNDYYVEMSVMSTDQVKTLDSLEHNRTIDVTELADADCYEIIGMDETRTVGHTHGAVYATSYGYFYINYDALDNSYFSSDGEFSYRGGTVAVAELEGEVARMVALQISGMEYREETYEFESDEDSGEFDPESAMVVFWILTVVLGVILPAVPLTFGLVYALKGKCLYPKRWYALVALSVAWIVVIGAIVYLIIR